jgi:hypothetical protein
VRHGDKQTSLFILYGQPGGVLNVPVLRVRQTAVASTIAKQIVSYLIDTPVRNRYSSLTIDDPYLGQVVEDALLESPLVENDGIWMKPNLFTVGSASHIAGIMATTQNAAAVSKSDNCIRSTLREGLLQARSVTQFAAIERTIRPAKITGARIPNCIVPIKPVWAQHLFDEDLAEQTLLGADVKLILGWENVFYRAPSYLNQLAPPCRMLWYVSNDQRYAKSGRIRACSTVIETQIIPARDAYRQYRRLGVYERNDVLRVGQGNPDAKVMVLRFADTEILEDPISYNTAIEVVRATDGLGQIKFQDPQPISEEAFVKLYSHGT